MISACFDEFDEVGVADAEAHAVDFGHVDGQHALLGLGRRRVDHLDRLGAERAPQDRLVAVAQRRLVDVELVRVHGALHDGFAEAVGRGDEHHVAEAGIGVEREHDAAGADVAADHVLDAGRQRDQRVIESLVHAVGDRAVVEQRREDFVHRLDHVRGAAHVEKRLLLARKRGFRQVFRRGGRAHRDRDVRAAVAHADVAVDDVLLQLRRERRRQDPVPDARAGFGQPGDVVDVERVEFLLDARCEALVREKLTVGVGGGREAVRHADPEPGQVRDHLAEGGILAADFSHVVAAEAGKGQGVRTHERPLARSTD